MRHSISAHLEPTAAAQLLTIHPQPHDTPLHLIALTEGQKQTQGAFETKKWR